MGATGPAVYAITSAAGSIMLTLAAIVAPRRELARDLAFLQEARLASALSLALRFVCYSITLQAATIV